MYHLLYLTSGVPVPWQITDTDDSLIKRESKPSRDSGLCITHAIWPRHADRMVDMRQSHDTQGRNFKYFLQIRGMRSDFLHTHTIHRNHHCLSFERFRTVGSNRRDGRTVPGHFVSPLHTISPLHVISF